jgi:hypothetical protein
MLSNALEAENQSAVIPAPPLPLFRRPQMRMDATYGKSLA